MPLMQEIDYGTPASTAKELVTLTIDGQQVTVPAGTSIMRAAMEAGVRIPKLCATDMLDSFGSCRVCLCEIEGRAGEIGTAQLGEKSLIATDLTRFLPEAMRDLADLAG